MKNSIVYFEPILPAFSSPVLHSQLFGEIKLLSNLGFDCHFYGVDHPEKISHNQALSFKQKYGMKSFSVVPSYHNGNGFSSIIKATHIGSTIIKSELKNTKPEFIYCRNIFAAQAIFRILKNMRGKTIFSCRGAIADEVLCKGGSLRWLKYYILKHLERKICRQAEHIVAVSNSMKKWIESFSERKDTIVIPCCYDESLFRRIPLARKQGRETLGWQDDVPVIAYCGGTSYWQRLPEILSLLASVQKLVPTLHILLLTEKPDQVRSLAATSGLRNDQIEARKVAHTEVPDWLNVADIGIILRHNIVVNNVSSPIKIAEYLACGLAIIATPGIGDYSLLIKKTNSGLIIQDPFKPDKIAALLTNRDRLQQYQMNAYKLSKQFSWSSNTKAYRKLYNIS